MCGAARGGAVRPRASTRKSCTRLRRRPVTRGSLRRCAASPSSAPCTRSSPRCSRAHARRGAAGPRRPRVLDRPSRRPRGGRGALRRRQGGGGDDGDAARRRARRRAGDLHRHRRRPARAGAGRRRGRGRGAAAARHGRLAPLPAPRGAVLRHRPVRHRCGDVGGAGRRGPRGPRRRLAAHAATKPATASTRRGSAPSASSRRRCMPAWC